MKRSISKVLTALAGLGASSVCWAGLLPSDYSLATTQNIYLSGSATHAGFFLGMARKLCQSGSLSQYSAPGNDVYFCSPTIGTGTGQINLQGGMTKIAIHVYTIGNSAAGVKPLINGTTLPFLDISKIAVGAGGNCTSVAPDYTGSPVYSKYGCASSATTSNNLSQIGFSDTEPAFFAPEISTRALTLKPAMAIPFAIPVSKGLRDKLQAYQGKTIGGESEVDMPSLTSAQLGSIFTFVGLSWSMLGYPMNVANGPISAPTAVPPLSDDGVYIARRVNTSGTQKVFEVQVTKSPNSEAFANCTVSTNPFVTTDSLANSGDAPTVCSGSAPATVMGAASTTDLKLCMINHDNARRGAIGMLSAYDMEPTTGTGQWRFVAIDGVSPTLRNVISGAYRLYAQTTYQYIEPSPTSNLAAFLAIMDPMLADSGIHAVLNTAYTHAWGRSGTLALVEKQNAPLPTIFPSDATIANGPIIPWTKTVGVFSNTCQGPGLFN